VIIKGGRRPDEKLKRLARQRASDGDGNEQTLLGEYDRAMMLEVRRLGMDEECWQRLPFTTLRTKTSQGWLLGGAPKTTEDARRYIRGATSPRLQENTRQPPLEATPPSCIRTMADDDLYMPNLEADDTNPSEDDAPPTAESSRALAASVVDEGAREEGLRAELRGVQQINALTEGIVTSLEKAKENMEVCGMVDIAESFPDLHCRPCRLPSTTQTSS
jgi:hypothetical protein